MPGVFESPYIYFHQCDSSSVDFVAALTIVPLRTKNCLDPFQESGRFKEGLLCSIRRSSKHFLEKDGFEGTSNGLGSSFQVYIRKG